MIQIFVFTRRSTIDFGCCKGLERFVKRPIVDFEMSELISFSFDGYEKIVRLRPLIQDFIYSVSDIYEGFCEKFVVLV